MQKVNKISLNFLLITCLFAAGMFLKVCRAESSSLPLSSLTRADESFTLFARRNLGTDWYGIYMQERKVGYLKSSTRFEQGPDRSSYTIQQSGIIHIPLKDETDEMKLHMVASFSAKPPYSLIRYCDRMIHEDDISEIKIISVPEGYQARITQGRETRTRMIGPLDYTFKDYAAVQKWIARGPRVGAGIKYPYLNPETLKLEENTSRITAIHKALVAGVKTTYYDVVTTGFDGLGVQEVFDSDGRVYSIVLGGLFECRLEPQALATRIDKTIDLFLRNTVSINKPLGNSEKIALLKLSLDATSGALIDNATGQSVTFSQTNDFVIVTLNPEGGYRVNATDEEIEKNLATTTHTPVDHPKITRMVRRAVGDAKSPEEKVRRLTQFVYRYIEDDYTANPLTVMDIIEKKKGDCSEHSKLFTAMARAMGIPCRTVGGLIYLGDEFQEFGLHAWNEVVIGGVWIPVDPTWGQPLVDATHIRFSVDISKEWEVMAVIPKIKMEVLHVEHKK
ncbi:MAG: transglutaminase domain-containing protein [Deltaproteobacteria bacterium]|nr:transglutaminase domain-containing protein [Deltaproteobacteria bacterium]